MKSPKEANLCRKKADWWSPKAVCGFAEMGSGCNEYTASFWGDENILILTGDSCRTVNMLKLPRCTLQWVNYMKCESDLTKVILKNSHFE